MPLPLDVFLQMPDEPLLTPEEIYAQTYRAAKRAGYSATEAHALAVQQVPVPEEQP